MCVNPYRSVILAVLTPVASVFAADRVSVFTKQLPGREAAAWEVEVVTRGEVESRVLDSEGDLVAGPFAAKRFAVAGTKAWSAEKPVWYTLVTESDGERKETVFGFAEQVIRGGRLYVNGRPVRVKAGPKALNGNAASLRDLTQEEAWKTGVYRLSASQLKRIGAETPAGNDAATKYRFRDWTVKSTNYASRIVVANRNAFTDGSEVELRWTLLVDGEEEDSGEIDLLGLPPGAEAAFDMPEEVTEARGEDGSVSVRFSFLRDGEVVAEDQLDLVASRVANALNPPEGWLRAHTPGWFKSSVSCEVEQGDVDQVRVFRTGGPFSRGVKFEFDEMEGLPKSFVKRGRIYDSAVAGAFALRSDNGSGESSLGIVYPPSPVETRGGAHTFVTLRGGDGVVGAARWTVYPNGIVSCRARLHSATAEPGTRLGFAMRLAEDDEDLEWYGLGPLATSKGDVEGAFLGRWEADGPEEFSAERVRGLRYGDLTVRTLGAPFSFKLTTCTVEARTVKDLAVFGEPGRDGVVELSFTLSVDDSELTARAPDGADDLPSLNNL